MDWICKTFDELSPHELYAMLQLRNEVFIVEQHCPYQDMDNKDPYCHHLMCWSEKKLVAYTRLVPPEISYAESSIGRVVSSPSVRRTGIGKILISKSIDLLKALYPGVSIKIGAQLYLKEFYESFSFKQTSETYIEDGIPHIEMHLSY
ncbi:MAG: GNAT family N-acetyltransferase [Chitinophagales bacterium]